MGAFLEKPNKQKKIQFYHHRKLRACSVQMQGWRKNMQDAILYDRLDKQVFIFGVFDGHSGAQCAQFCSIHFAVLLKQDQYYQKGLYKQSLINVFAKLDQKMDTPQGEAQMRKLTLQNGMQPFNDGSKVADSVGCTANVVLIVGSKIYIANAGDSRSVLSRNSKAVQLSKDHKPQNKQQLQRILASGATVQKGRINSHLNLSRSLGDLHYKRNADLPKNKQTVISEPDIFEIQLSKQDQFIIIGCDGVWQRYQENPQGLISLIRQKRNSGMSPQNTISQLLDSFLSPNPQKQQLGCDNMSCILIQFNKLQL